MYITLRSACSSLLRIPRPMMPSPLQPVLPRFTPGTRFLSSSPSRRQLPDLLVNTAAPKVLQPYLRLMRADKPIGTWLLLYPSLWSMTIATPVSSAFPSTSLVSSFVVGAFLMRGAGCTINDYWDRNIDKHVERTKNRPLASGEISETQALSFLGLQVAVSAGIALSLNPPTLLLAAASLPFVAVYPLMKRITKYPQAFLGLTFNWGVWMGYAAVTADVAVDVCLPLYFASWCWTMVYDTIYAMQDAADDRKVGIGSTALTFGDDSKMYMYVLTMLFAVSMYLSLKASESVTHPWAELLIPGAAGSVLAMQIKNVQPHNVASCLKTFVAQKHVGLGIFVGLLGAHWLASAAGKHEVHTVRSADDVSESRSRVMGEKDSHPEGLTWSDALHYEHSTAAFIREMYNGNKEM